MDINRNILAYDARLSDVLELLNSGVNGIVLIVDDTGRLVGIYTDGDARRAVLSGAVANDAATEFMNKNFNSASAAAGRQHALTQMSENCRHLPLLDQAGCPVDLVSWSEIWRVGVSAPHLGGNEMKYVDDCLVNGWISSQGHYVNQFEEALTQFLDVKHAIVTSSGTTALHLALAALDIKSGDEVILPNSTFGATANTIIQSGAKPVFIDVDSYTWTINPELIHEAITPKTRAIMPVHLYGFPCHMRPIQEIASSFNLAVIEDCAEALGARYEHRMVGSLGDIGCFSFFANKVITTGEGGVAVTNDDELATRMRLLCNHGMDPDRKYWHLIPGYNYRMTNLQAAVGLAQLEQIQKFLNHRDAITKVYNRYLDKVPGVIRQSPMTWAEPICWLHTILLNEDMLQIDRDFLMKRLALEGVDSRPFFPPLHEQPAFSNDSSLEYPVSSMLAARGLSLPTSNVLSEEEVGKIARLVKQLVEASMVYTDAGYRTP